ncbi:MAG: hypothetical protein ACQERC_01715 [Bacteroidota bacterium]
MKNDFLFVTVIFVFITVNSCQKDLTGSPISIEARTNYTITDLVVHGTNQTHYCPPLASPAATAHFYGFIPYIGGGLYQLDVDEDASVNYCITIRGTIPAIEDTTGTTKVAINAFFTKHGNVFGFHELELKRPHDEHHIVHRCRPDTYIE